MAGAKVQVQITTSELEIRRSILKECKEQLDTVIKDAVPPIKRKIQVTTRNLIVQSPEYSSIISGDLKGHLGLEDPERVMTNIIGEILNNIEVKFGGTAFNNNELFIDFSVSVLRSDYADILSLPDASYISTNRVGSRQGAGNFSGAFRQRSNKIGTRTLIPWLQWLLLVGDTLVVHNYSIKFGDFPGSRSGLALMYNSVKSGLGGWQIPREYAGTEDNNFLTRALINLKDYIEDIVSDEIQKRI